LKFVSPNLSLAIPSRVQMILFEQENGAESRSRTEQISGWLQPRSSYEILPFPNRDQLQHYLYWGTLDTHFQGGADGPFAR